MVLAAREANVDSAPEMFAHLRQASARLAKTRPTAVNLFVALRKMEATLQACERADKSIADIRAALEESARAFIAEDKSFYERIGTNGAELFVDGDVVLTICHTGALATCGQGTALGVLKSAQAQGKKISVVAVETRPLLQGARLTAWECLRSGLDVTLITDSMIAFALARKGITKAIVGADRIARNGDTANKIGTYSLATLCAARDIPVYVAAPTSTFDVSLQSGAEIPIEERDGDEIRIPRGCQFAPTNVPVWNPAFDVTPAELLRGIVTEKGVWHAPFGADVLRSWGLASAS
jgi:methylthioribose-1-phosphate isomerase